MKNFFYKASMLALSASIVLTSCNPEIDVPSASTGEADFTTYVAVGNSLTAGFGDNGLYREGQLSSYPSILAQQFEAVGGGEFNQPLFSEEHANGSGYLRLTGFTEAGSPITTRVTENLAFRNDTELFIKYLEPIQNLGVPGIRVSDVTTAGYGSALGNPYFERITPDGNPLQTYLQRVQAAEHTFFSLWLGNNDVLGYATAGGASGSITPTGTFDTNYSALVNALTAEGQKGIICTVPNVTTVPFFTTVGPSVKQALAANELSGMIAITGAGKERTLFLRDQINAAEGGVLFTLTGSAYAPLLGQPTGKYWRDLAAQVSPSEDMAVIRATLAGLLATYEVDTTQMFGLSPGNPWPSALLLDAAEQAKIKDAVDGYNAIITAHANAKDLAVFDANAFFTSIQAGFSSNGVAYSPAFITGNLFSLDGIHPTPRGYAIIANEMIKAINTKYNSKIATVDETQYRAVLLP
ncbi:SGNH/GDSL hydrolase family protein [Pontibacter silvestris]|uniref:SGNH/GDSL hydrolase family protein n=1 Tax=Pontibacter silvestris TaxID=2305183 RepID=A0ABW4X123_9BACT|nr:SGNH/GDSL hydrolase family protein [Pontibacter silvestris]MCC9135819.1 SGNH/GDSL hydrolase family protein [Pontibacter silvestris]